MPEGRTIPGLDKSALGLFPARVEVLCGLVFVNLDIHAAPLAEQVAGLPERLAPLRLREPRAASTTSTSQPANWKIVVDNYLEGYHVPVAHPGLMRLLDYKRYDVELYDNWVWFDAPLRDKPSGNLLERPTSAWSSRCRGWPKRTRASGASSCIYPNTTIDLYPDQIGIWQILPDGTGATRRRHDAAAPRRQPAHARRAGSPTARSTSWSAMRTSTWWPTSRPGIETHGFEPGPLSRREAALGWFADRIRADLGQAA